MNTFNLIIVVTALSMEAFSSIYLNGFLNDKATSWKAKARLVMLVSFAAMVMASLGYFTGEILSTILSEFSTGLSIGILFIVGLKLVIKSFKPKFREMTWELTQPKVALAFSVALSINPFLLGLAIPGMAVTIPDFLVAVALVFFVSALLATIFGIKGTRFLLASRMMLGGGLVVAGSAIYYIIQSFNLI